MHGIIHPWISLEAIWFSGAPCLFPDRGDIFNSNMLTTTLFTRAGPTHILHASVGVVRAIRSINSRAPQAKSEDRKRAIKVLYAPHRVERELPRPVNRVLWRIVMRITGNAIPRFNAVERDKVTTKRQWCKWSFLTAPDYPEHRKRRCSVKHGAAKEFVRRKNWKKKKNEKQYARAKDYVLIKISSE